MTKVLNSQIVVNIMDSMPSHCENMHETINMLQEVNACDEETVFRTYVDPYCNFLDLNLSSDEIFVEKGAHVPDNNFFDSVCPYGVTKVCFTGGGAKGFVYVGTFPAMLACGQMYYNSFFCGSSVGAVAALFHACITPSKKRYEKIKCRTVGKNINDKRLNEMYSRAVDFLCTTVRNCDLVSLYNQPSGGFSSLWHNVITCIKNIGLYDSGNFKLWLALVCMWVCQSMENGLGRKIMIHDERGKIVTFRRKSCSCYRVIDEEDINTQDISQWKVVSFFSFEDYYVLTGKKITITGTNTKTSETVYFSNDNDEYKDLSVLQAVGISICYPWIFQAHLIGETYYLDGGIYDNYPITVCDTENYDNQICGYYITEENDDSYESLRELWILHQELKSEEGLCEVKKAIANLLFSPSEILSDTIKNIGQRYCSAFLNLLEKLKSQNITSMSQMLQQATVHGQICDEIEKKYGECQELGLLLSHYHLKKSYALRTPLKMEGDVFRELGVSIGNVSADFCGKSLGERIVRRSRQNTIEKSTGITSVIKMTSKKLINYLFNTEVIYSLVSKYLIKGCMIETGDFDRTRTINVNSHETTLLQKTVPGKLQARIAREGFVKTLAFFATRLKGMEENNVPQLKKQILTYKSKYIHQIKLSSTSLAHEN